VSRELVTGLRSCVLLQVISDELNSLLFQMEHLLETDVPKIRVRDIAHEDPANLEYTLPLV